MVARGRTVGLVELEQLSNGRRFVADDIRLAQALANQAAVAIENAQLFERTRRFTEELEQRVKERTQELARVLEDLTIERDRVEVLYRVASELSSSLDLDQVLNRTLELVEDAVGATEGAILLREAESGRLMCRATTGADAPLPPGGKPFPLPKGEGLIWWIIRNGKMVVVDDLHADSRWMKRDGRHSCLATPLGAAGEVQGVLTLYHHEVDHFTSDHVRLIEAAGSQISNAIGNAALYNLIRDQAEQLGTMLKQQQVEAAKSQAILEGVADGVMVADAQGHVILFNAAAEHVLGIPREKVLGRSTREMMGLYGVEGRSWMAAINEWIANPSDHAPGDFTAERIQVGERIVSVHVSPVIMGTEFLGTVSVFRDITVEVEADRAKSEFVSTVSHELRTPMTSIKGYADLLLMGAVGGLSEQQRHFMNIIRNNANRLTSLVNDLLDISRIETGRVELNLRAVPISEIVDQVITTLEGRAHERGLELRKEISDDALPVWGDSDRLTQILTNLVGNAIQYTPSGGHITVAAQPDGDMLEVAVIDTGIGISEENLRKIFDRFFRADDPFVQETSGTGLGLAITTSLVHMHGGEIWVESELGEGSTFFFTLPFARSVTSDELLPPGTDNSHILVVEDDQDVADLIRIHLESRNYKVAIAERGEEALEMASRLQPALITLDIRLPDADGFFILQELKKKPETANIPVVIVSVMTTAEESLRLGAVDYVGKPIDENALLGAVKQVLDKRGLILVVEDDRDILALIRDALKRQGYRVRTTRRGRRALQVAREAHPALILLDMRLEDIDGYQVLRNLKSQPQTQDIPIVVITGSLTQEELKNEVLALGAARFLTKPFAVEELIHEIAAVLEQPEAQGEVVSD
jgi:PAS domain S-box-containing protein